MKKTKLTWFILTVFLLTIFALTTCDTPMGMGDPIDWEPPILRLDPKPPTPFYVGRGAQLSGTVTDNIAVDKVILRDTNTGEQRFTAQLSGNRWWIDLNFSEEQNGETILADVVAYDKNGNSGAESIAPVVLIIDIHDPIVDDIWVQRTTVRTADLMTYNDLKKLESDIDGVDSKNVELYQNGAFWIKAKITEEDTSIKTVTLKIYDSEYPNIELLSKESDPGSKYSPQWLITEDDILDKGVNLISSNYKDNYKTDNKRYYYRLRIVATDMSGNNSVEEQDYICLWNKADDPKGILDPLVVGGGTNITITKGSQLPVEFFDDDKLDWAYAALFTKEQWAGTKSIGPGNLADKNTDEDKFSKLKDWLTSGNNVYNWRYDRKSLDTSEPVENQTPGGADEKTYYIITGNNNDDFGDFVFVSLVKDKKQSPHTGGFYPDRTAYRKYNVTIVDENAPLIVFDKVNGSPEENTFPELDSAGNFKIHGYTLREDKNISGSNGGSGTGGTNKVTKFRIAWVPFNLVNNYKSSDYNNKYNSAEEHVKAALAITTLGDSDFPAGVQWWNFDTEITSSANTYVEEIGTNRFRKQKFTKTFNILGGTDDKKGGSPDNYKNFYYDYKKADGTPGQDGTQDLENETKLFIFYAEDNMGHPVTTQFYLLGNKTPPTIDIYDITDKVTMFYDAADASHTNSPPSVYEDSNLGDITSEYITKRNNFNKAKYPTLKGVSVNDSGNIKLTTQDKTDNYRLYPKGTIVKLWANATATGALAIDKVIMEDMTYSTITEVGFSGYNATPIKEPNSLGYVEYFPEVTQRTFKFTATDRLGNTAVVQRTVAIANAAALTSITTAEQNGTYPAGKEIVLKANFDGLIRLENNNDGYRPKLNIMYQLDGVGYGVEQIECKALSPSEQSTGVLSLTFTFKVPVNAKGKIETLYDGIGNKPSSNPSPFKNIDNLANINVPISIVDKNSRIIDVVREDSAYTPGNVTGFFWKTVKNSLQYDATDNKTGKEIKLDGVIPKILTVSIDTKAPFTTNNWYLKSGESISFIVTATKPLKINGDSSLSFRLQKPDNTYTTYNTTNFDYRKVTGSMITYTLDVSRQTIPDDGILQSDITLVNPGNITDEVGNPIENSTFATALSSFITSKNIYFDLTTPPKPVTTLQGITGIDVGTNPTQTINYSTTPYMNISPVPTASEPYGAETRQYSLDGGLNWVSFPTAIFTTEFPWTTANPTPDGTLFINNGQWSLKTRYIDKAGNEGATTDQLIYVNDKFPNLLGVSAVQSNAIYIGGQTLSFTLDFDDEVTADTNVTLTLKDTTSTADVSGGSSPSYISANLPATVSTGKRTVTFTWTLVKNTKDMPNGLSVSAINIGTLKDKFGNTGPAVTIGAVNATTGQGTVTLVGQSAVSYNLSGVIVSTIDPLVVSREPQHAGGRTGNITEFYGVLPPATSPTFPKIASGSISDDNKTIRLNFNKAMQRGNGTITIRPHGNYAIPAVFENDELYEIFNNPNVTNANKTAMVGGTSMSNPPLDNVMGLSVGPYKKMTHGLIAGAGYSGNYGNQATFDGDATTDITRPGRNAPGPRTGVMIPDLAVKYVLDYKYDDLFSDSDSVITGIRTALDNAKWRWQEIAINADNVKFDGNSVTITLSEPLQNGLQWDVIYPAGTFTDLAGNSAVGVAKGDYWFWSKGVQIPVIRVDRKSYDARTGTDFRGNIAGQKYSATGYNGAISAFNNIGFKITSETPNARIFYNTLRGAYGSGSVTGAWSDEVSSTGTYCTNVVNNGTQYILWAPPAGSEQSYIGDTIGTWVRPNLIFRQSRNGTYYIMENGFNISTTVGASGQGNGNSFTTALDGSGSNNKTTNLVQKHYGFRSYNKDATSTELNAITFSKSSGQTANAPVTQSLNYSAYQASKDYVASIASIDHTHTGQSYTPDDAVDSAPGFEGVFRTVIMINQDGLKTLWNDANLFTATTTSSTSTMLLSGSTARNAIPTVAGFPIKDGTHLNDSRYCKVFYHDVRHFYWVSSEIVSKFYVQPIGDGSGSGSYTNMGDEDNWITCGYGDLSYAYNIVN